MSTSAKLADKTPQIESGNGNNNFKILNNIAGWSVFGIAFLVYLLTLERTASFWDCGEFIACAYKLQVPHPPGAPFFLLVGRLFSMLSFGDATMVAYWINVSSALYSAFTILFLFWSITLLGLKFTSHRSLKSLSEGEGFALIGAGIVGALAYTFSDSFWFSAVEAEVYAMSSFFTAFVVWAMLKWEHIEDEADANRWLILIAYMMGLSIGVHLLNLVTLPALGLIYYFKKYPNPNLVGVFAALAISGAFVILILEGVITGLASIASTFEITFVNTFGLPFGSGAVTFAVLLLGGLVYGIYHSQKHEKVLLNNLLLGFAFVLIGYSSYSIALVRSNYNPPINENDPSDIIKFISYLKREQYGDRPLLYGPTFNSDVARDSDGNPVQTTKGKVYRVNKEKGIYEAYHERKSYVYEDNILLPRVYSRQDNHKRLYQQILGLSEQDMTLMIDGMPVPNPNVPNMGHNLQFLFTHQFGHMYFRYFMWNFAGRAGDVQDDGWITGFESEEDLPQEVKENKARNKFYMLPLLLGILGAVFAFQRSQQTFFITAMLFFLTGLALVLYLNSPPVEPRERDYIYAGSFYAFAIWIGFGVLFLTDVFRNFLKNAKISMLVATLLGLTVPGIMATEGWDDHNRSNRYHSVDSARNLLESCAPNAILFTGGDNDTFPLWYLQEVEGVRTDVRVCNLSLLGTDWYIDQMKRPVYESAALPISLDSERYLSGRNDQILYAPRWRINTNLSPSVLKSLSEKGMDLKTYIDLVNQNDPKVKASSPNSDEKELTIIPSQKLVYKFDREKVLAQKNFVPKDKQKLVKNFIAWDLGADDKRRRAGFQDYSDFYKSHLLIMDMIATNNWERPIYFSTTLGSDNYLNLKEYFQEEGLAYRLMPYRIEGATQGKVNTDIMYRNLMEKFSYRELDNPRVYYDENYRRFPMSLRNSFYRLASALVEEGKEEKAKKAVKFCLDKIPDEVFPINPYYGADLVEVLFAVNDQKGALKLGKTLANRAEEKLKGLFERNQADGLERDMNLLALSQLIDIFSRNKREKEAAFYNDVLQKYIEVFDKKR